MRDIDKVAVWVSQLRLHAAQTENYFVIALARQVFRGVQRLSQSDSKTTLEQNRKLFLAANEFQQLEILRVARANLEHDSRGIAGKAERFLNLIDMRFMRDLHGYDFDSILAGEF